MTAMIDAADDDLVVHFRLKRRRFRAEANLRK